MRAPEAFTATEPAGHFINGQVRSGASGRSQAVYNPATGEAARQVALASAAEVNAAVASAKAAFAAWADTPPIRRARVMFKFLELMNRHRDALAAMITSELGKVFADAQGEVSRGIDIVEFACGIPQLLKGDYTERRCPPESTTGRCGNRSAWWPALHPSTFRAWCRAGCSRWR